VKISSIIKQFKTFRGGKMKIFKNIARFLGFMAYKNISIFFVSLLVCGTLSVGISGLMLEYSSSPYLFLLLFVGLMIFISFFVGIENMSPKNWRVAILRAGCTQDDLNQPKSWMTPQVLRKISALIMDTRQTKDPTKLNEFIQKVQKYNQMKKNQKEKRELYKNLPDEINKLDTEIHLFENFLFH